jgi:hypothetical protein
MGLDAHLAKRWPHALNVLECVRSRQKPRSDIEKIRCSTSAPLIGMIARKVGRKLYWQAKDERFIGDEDEKGNRLLAKEYRKPWNVA